MWNCLRLDTPKDYASCYSVFHFYDTCMSRLKNSKYMYKEQCTTDFLFSMFVSRCSSAFF